MTPCPACTGVNPNSGISWRNLCDPHLNHLIRFGYCETERSTT